MIITEELKPENVRVVTPSPLIPEGTYPGLMTGYVVEFQAGDVKYAVALKHGIRGIDFRVWVHIENGNIVVRSWVGNAK